MKSILLILKREFMVFRHQWMRVLAFFLIFPMFMFLCISMPLFHIVSVPSLNYLHWSVPGILILASSIICSNYCVKNIFILRDKDRYYQLLLKSPVNISHIIGGIYMTSILYGILQFAIASILLSILNPGVFSFIQCFLIFIQTVAFLLFIGSFSLTFGFLISNEEVIPFFIIVLFIVIAFAFGALLPIDLFPEELFKYLDNIPMVNIIMNVQRILYMEAPLYFVMFLNIMIGIVFYSVGIIFAYKTLRKHP